jgi:hypothetical protein
MFFEKAVPELSILLLVFWLIFGIFADSLYHDSVKKKIAVAQLTIKNEVQLLEFLRYKGGVNTWVAWVSGGLPVVGIVASIALVPLLAKDETKHKHSSAPVTQIQPTPVSRYYDNGGGTVKDFKTNLEWMRCSLGQNPFSPTCEGEAKEYSWNDAMKLTTNFAGHNDWRVPTNEELRSLIYCSDNKNKTLGKEEAGYICTGSRTSPTINTTYFPNTPSHVFWSSSPYASLSCDAWYVGFGNGSSYCSYKGNSNSVRLVRG